MNIVKSHNRSGKRFARTLHYIVLLTMLHSTFIAPAQGIIEAWVHNKKGLSYKGFRGGETPPADETQPLQPQTKALIAPALQSVLQPKISFITPNKPLKMVYGADLKEGVIGISKDKPIDNPFDNIFNVALDRLPQADEKVYLSYELYGLSEHHSVARSINDRFSTGGYLVKLQQGWSNQKEELNPAWLKAGVNKILFTLPRGAGYQYKVKNLSVVMEKSTAIAQQLVLHSQSTVLTKDGKIYIKGFLRGNNPGTKVQAGDTWLEVIDNEFEGYVTLDKASKDNGMLAISAVNSKGLLGREILFLDNLAEADMGFAIENKSTAGSKIFTAHKSTTLAVDGASIAVSDTVLAADYEISITQLRNIDIPPMESGMVNVTKGGKAYRFLPDGTQFEKPVSINIAYDTLLLPTGYTAKDIRTYFFDTDSKNWKQVQKDTIDTKLHTVTSSTTHFTDYINGIIQAPESPETSAFTPTMMNNIKAADPSAEMTIIAPPQASQRGDAGISYPIKIPAGRNGIQPNLSIQYSNENNNGWLGKGWSINTPSITIDTRWGVPIFDAAKETELYSLNGEMLMYPNAYMPHRHQDVQAGIYTTEMQLRTQQVVSGVKTFLPRKQGSFSKIERLGTAPSNYYWKVTSADGTISWYGAKVAGDLTAASPAVLRDANNNIVHWGLFMVEDVHGNYMKYEYTNAIIPTSQAAGVNVNLSNGRIFYIKKISYTGNGAISPVLAANYQVEFVTNTTVRPDASINNRLGLKQIDPYRLTNIYVRHTPTSANPIRTYSFAYGMGKLGKTKLQSVTEAGINYDDYYTHNFEYYDDITQDGLDVYFDAEIDFNICDDPCIDTDGDGVCDEDDDCPTIAGTLPNGCNPGQGSNCYTLTFEKPTIYKYTYTSPKISGNGTSCFSLPAYVSSMSFGQIGSTSSFSPSNLYLTNYNGTSQVSLCPSTLPQTNYTGVQYSGFNVAMQNYLNNNVFPGLDIYGTTVTNYSSVSGVYEWGWQTYYTLSFLSSFSDLNFSSNISFNGVINSTMSIVNQTLTQAVSATGMPVEVLVNGQPLAQPTYNLHSNLSSFISAFQQQYPQAQITSSGNFITIYVPNTSAVLTSLSVHGDLYTFSPCGTGLSKTLSTPAAPPNYFANMENNFSIGFSGTASGGNPDCPSFLNYDFQIQGTIPSFQTAGAVLGSTKATSYTAGGYLGVGIGWSPYTNTTTFGGGYTRGWDKSESLTQMIDIDGDGLDDVVSGNGDNIYYKKHSITVSQDINGLTQVNHSFGPKTLIQGMDKFYRQEGTSDSFNFDISMGFAGFGGFAGKDGTTSRSEADIFFTDGNGDGLPDIVRHDRVYFNRLNSSGIPTFENVSENTENMIITAEPLEVVVPAEYFSSNVDYPDNDVVKVWEAPASGTIKIINSIELTDITKQSMVTIEMEPQTQPCKQVSFPVPSLSLYKYYNENYGFGMQTSNGLNCALTSIRYANLQVNGTPYDITSSNIFLVHGNSTSPSVNLCQGAVATSTPNYIIQNPYCNTKIYTAIQNRLSLLSIPYYNLTPQTRGYLQVAYDDNTAAVNFGIFAYQFWSPTNMDFKFGSGSAWPTNGVISTWSTNPVSAGYKSGPTPVSPNVIVSVNGVAMANTYNFQNNFNLFKSDFEALYPGTTVYYLAGSGAGASFISINGYNSSLNTITITPANSSVSGNTYNFSPCGPPLRLAYQSGEDDWKGLTLTNEEANYGIKKWIADGNELEQPFIDVPFTHMFDFTDNGKDKTVTGSYTYVKEGDKANWYNSDATLITAAVTLKALDGLLPEDFDKHILKTREDNRATEFNRRKEAQITAIAEIEKLDNEKAPQYQAMTFNPTTCAEEPTNLCQLFGVQLSASNSIINNTITTYNTACNSSQGTVYVQKGDRIYFRVHSIDNGNPAVNWDPRVEYTNATLAATVDENGLNVYKSNYSEGFILSEAGRETVFTGNGTAEFTWPSITVSSPSDQVTFEIVKKVLTGPESSYGSLTETTVYRKTCAPGVTTTVSTSNNEIAGVNLNAYAVTGYTANNSNPQSQSATVFYFRVKATSNVRWKQYEWRPKMACHTTQQVIGDSGTSEGNVDIEEIKYPIPDYSLYSLYACSAQYNRYALTGSVGSTCTIAPSLSGIFSSGDTGVLYFVVKKNGLFVGRKTITINNGSVSISAGTISTVVASGNKIEMGYYADDTKVYLNSASLLNKLAQTGNKVAILTYAPGTSVNIYKQDVNLYHKGYQKFGPMYRQWGQFMYNPSAVTGAQALSGLPGYLIKESALNVTEQTASAINDAATSLETAGFEDYNLDTDYVAFENQLNQFQSQNSALFNTALIPARPQRNYINGGYDERWTGMHAESYTTAAAYRAAMFTQLFDGVDGGSDDISQGVLQTGAFAINKFSTGSGKNISGGFSAGFPVSGASVSVSGSKSLDGNNKSLTDYVDMNGDRYPDIVSTEKIQFTTRTGGLFTSQTLHTDFDGDLSASTSGNWGVGASGSFYRGSKETEGSKGASQNKPKFTLKGAKFGEAEFDLFSGSSSIGISGQFSKGDDKTSKLWLDLNGDGLADLLEKNGSNMSVKINNGRNLYTATQQGTTWAGFELNKGAGTSFGGGLGYSYKNGSIEAGYSLGKTVSDSQNNIMDINSDGLPDLIYCTQDNFYVSLNDGNGFGTSQQWADFSLHKSAQTTKSSLNIGGTVAWIWPLYLLVTVIPIKLPAISAKASRSTSTNNTKKTVADFDGDGFPDLLREISPGNLKIRSSRIRRTDMLKSVTNPLGGKFTVNYGVSRPTYDNPDAKWVMTDLVVEDGYNFDGDGVDAYFKKYEYENARFDRREREFYGFETIKSIDYTLDQDGQPDQVYRTSVTKYHNRSYFLNGLVKESYLMNGSNINQLYSKTVNSYGLREIIYTAGQIGLLNSTSLPLTFDTGGREGRKGAAALLTKIDTYLYEFGSNPLSTSVLINYDNYGRVIQYTDNATNLSNDDYKSEITYHSDAVLIAKNLINIPKTMKVYGKDTGSFVLKRERDTQVDLNNGNITKIRIRLTDPSISPTVYAATNMEYYANGNLKKVTKPANSQSQSMWFEYTYDTSDSKYLISVTDAFNQVSATTYDYRFDKPLKAKDISGNEMHYTYDNFGRVATIIGPKELEQNVPYTIKFNYYPIEADIPSENTCLGESVFVPFSITQHYDEQHTGNDIETITFIDGLARQIQVKKDIEINTGTTQSPDYEERMSVSGRETYDEFGRTIEQYHLMQEAKHCSINYAFNEVLAPDSSQIEYDVIDRPVKTTDPIGSISTTEYSMGTNLGVTGAKTKTVVQQSSSANIITENYKDITGKILSAKKVQTGTNPQDINTLFAYNSINEVIGYTDAGGISVTYKYDFAGRRIQVNNPDYGKTSYEFDDSGNLIQLQTSNLENNYNLQPQDRFIKYKYDYNRLIEIRFSDTPGGPNIANAYYAYGAAGSGNNTGKIIYQEDATGEQFFEYGIMGELLVNKRTVVGPNIPTRTFTTSFEYDSWNRLKMMIYPDGEKVKYTYNLGGNLNNITGTINNNPYEYVKRIDYDHYEQRIYQLFGNNTETNYTYSADLRRLENLIAKTSMGDNMFNNIYTYDKIGNVTESLSNVQPNPVNNMGGYVSHNYFYDNLNRLIYGTGDFYGDSSQAANNNNYDAHYAMFLEYNTTNGITVKGNDNYLDGAPDPDNFYSNEYEYASGTHKLIKVEDQYAGTSEIFKYDFNGNMAYREDETANITNYYWDESNRLRVVDDQVAMQHYIYDAGGSRILKAGSHLEAVYENGSLVNTNVTFDGYTTYPSGYLVVAPDGRYSKHYYEGSERIVSRIGEQSADIFEQNGQPRMAAPGTLHKKGMDESMLRNIQVTDLVLLLKKANKGIPAFTAYDEGINKDGDAEPAKPKSGYTTNATPPQQEPYHNIYFYHNDQLGTGTYLTDANGMPYQFFLNMPFGETMAEQHSLTEDYETPYKFNGKELDKETGLYYYGARYYDPHVSTWLSVDPLVEKYPGNNPYIYCVNNPVNLIDPDGRDWVEDKNGNITWRKEVTAKNYKNKGVLKDGETYRGTDYNRYKDWKGVTDGNCNVVNSVVKEHYKADGKMEYTPTKGNMNASLEFLKDLVDQNIPYSQSGIRNEFSKDGMAALDCSETVALFLYAYGSMSKMTTLATLYMTTEADFRKAIGSDKITSMGTIVPSPGDIFVWRKSDGSGHTGVVLSYDKEHDTVTILEAIGAGGSADEATNKDCGGTTKKGVSRIAIYDRAGGALESHAGWKGYYRPKK